VIWVIFLIIVYAIFVISCVRKIVLKMYFELEEEALVVEREVKCLTEKKDALYAKKSEFEKEALEIFTLYEITKEITQSLNEEDAFEIFKKKLHEHVGFEECHFLDPLSNEVEKLKELEDYVVFTLKGKQRKIGYLAMEGLPNQDKEKFMILAHQFALALRRVKLYQEIEKIAITDALTEVYTRRYILERLKEELGRSKAHKINISFLMLDVDYFKNINDEYGHLTGDQVLREMGEIIRNNIREIDIAGRYGGEEFCVVLPDTDREGSYYAAERIRQATEIALIKAYDAVVNVTLSVGTATFPEDGIKVDEIIDKADWALYRAKKQGRNRVCSFGVYE